MPARAVCVKAARQSVCQYAIAVQTINNETSNPRQLNRSWAAPGGQLSAPEPDLQRVVARVGRQLLPKAPAGGPSAGISDANVGAGIPRDAMQDCEPGCAGGAAPPPQRGSPAPTAGAPQSPCCAAPRCSPAGPLPSCPSSGAGSSPWRTPSRPPRPPARGPPFSVGGGACSRSHAAAVLLGIRGGRVGGGCAAMREQGELSPRHSGFLLSWRARGGNGLPGRPGMSVRPRIVNTYRFPSGAAVLWSTSGKT